MLAESRRVVILSKVRREEANVQKEYEETLGTLELFSYSFISIAFFKKIDFIFTRGFRLSAK